MSVSKEVWKPIKGYEGLYEVSNLGRVKSTERRGAYGLKENGRIRSLGERNGYRYIALCKDGKYKKQYVHRLVAQAFIPNPENLPCVNHKDESKGNNRVDNLEWCTYRYNSCYGSANEKRAKQKSKPVIATNVATGEKEYYASAVEAIKKLSKYQRNGNITAVLKGKRKTAFGRTWEYGER